MAGWKPMTAQPDEWRHVRGTVDLGGWRPAGPVKYWPRQALASGLTVTTEPAAGDVVVIGSSPARPQGRVGVVTTVLERGYAVVDFLGSEETMPVADALAYVRPPGRLERLDGLDARQELESRRLRSLAADLASVQD